MSVKLSFIVVLVFLPHAMLAQRPMVGAIPQVARQSLDEKVKAEISDFKGKVWIYAKNLETGKEFALRADEQVRTASTIKLPIMTEAFRQVSQGKLKWTDEIVLTKQNKQGGSGILSEFTDDTNVDLRTAVNLMIVVSDNTATNLVLEKLGADKVNELMGILGLKDTLSLRKIGGGGDSKAAGDPINKLFGIGRSSPRDMVKLLEMLERGKVVSEEASAEMIAILKRQQYKDGIGRNVLDTVPVASKSGSLDRLRSDVGIVYTRRGRIAMAITVDDMPVVHYSVDDMGNELIWRLSLLLQEGLAR
ncbi:MAG: serine hydrolase [Pyrinomonadaceae bacterium]